MKLCNLCLTDKPKRPVQTQMIAIGPNRDYWVCPICDGPAWMNWR